VQYSPSRRTALVFSGTGAHGAYHAGVLRALQEAGVKIDVVAGQGIGAAAAMLAAIDGGSRLWDADGIWRSPEVKRFYRFNPFRWQRRVRRVAGSPWWRMFGAPYDPAPVISLFSSAVWQLIRGAAQDTHPPHDAGRRYAEMLAENLGQPGFRELMIVATDLDSRGDVVAAMLREPYKRDFIASRPGRERRSEALDLSGAGRAHAFDIVSAALTPPVACEPRLVSFASDGYWRGETHRLCDRPGSVIRLLEELAGAGVSQVVVVTAVTVSPAPHRLRTSRLDVRGRLGEFIAASEAATLREASELARLRFDAFYAICPSHNPVGPFDFGGAYDEASDRRHSTGELMDRGYEDAYHQFIEPVVGASGDMIAHASRHADRPRGIPEAH
jgi:hypothetical protein